MSIKKYLSILCLSFVLVFMTAACSGTEFHFVSDAEKIIGYLGLTAEEIAEKTGENVILAHSHQTALSGPRRYGDKEYTLYLTVNENGPIAEYPVGANKTIELKEGSVCGFYYFGTIEQPEKNDVMGLDGIISEMTESYGKPITYEGFTTRLKSPNELWNCIEAGSSGQYFDDWDVDSPFEVRLTAKYNVNAKVLTVTIRYATFIPPNMK